MTVKELIAFFAECAELDENFMDFNIMMTGHDDYGYRQHNIPVKDITTNHEDKVVRLWDN